MFFKDLLFPKFCLGCGFLGAYICSTCQHKLKYISADSCLYCGKKSLYGLTHPGCKRQNGVDGALSIFYYNNLLKAVIKSIKYRLATDVWKELCLLIDPDKIAKLRFFRELQPGNFFLEPVPLHNAKLMMRGFNQAKIIADFFNRFLNLPVSGYLVRRLDTPAQAQMKNNRDRYQNMQGAFAATDKLIQGKNLVLVDDVLTTGSTVKAAAKTLKQAGAKRVFVLTLAKG